MLTDMLTELRALGWRAIVHGPEIHLVLPLAHAVIGAVLLAMFCRRRRRK